MLAEELLTEELLDERLDELTGARELLVATIDDALPEDTRLDELLLEEGTILDTTLLDDDLLEAGTDELVVAVAHAPKSVQALAQAQPTPGS